MGSIINAIISNDLLFYGIIVFLIVGVILLFMYLHHKKFIDLLEEEIEFTKVDDEKINESLQNLAEVSNVEKIVKDEPKFEEIDSQIDGKSAIEKIMNENISEKEKIEAVEDTKVENVVEQKSENKKFENVNKVEEKETEQKSENKKFENVNKVEEKETEQKSELELMLEKMQHDLEEQKEKDAVAIFEQEQEEKSIISYKELLERKSELTNSLLLNDERFENEPTITEDNDLYANYADLIEEKEHSLTDNYIKLVDNVNDTISIDKALDENENKKNGSKKFVTTDFISPVFGRRKAEFDYPKVPNFKEMMMKKEKTNEYDLEATLNLEPLAEQMKKDDAFLSALKEFRKNLE